METPRNQITGRVMVAIAFTSGASAIAKVSALCMASRLAVSSPITMEKYEMITVIVTRDTGPATDSGRPQPISTAEVGSSSVAPPKAADRNPDMVTPICTADRNRFGLAASAATVRPRWPRVESCLTWLSRSDTSAISAAANTPPTMMNRKISRMLLTMGFIEWSHSRGTAYRAAFPASGQRGAGG